MAEAKPPKDQLSTIVIPPPILNNVKDIEPFISNKY
jgi:hypothetical protein